MKKKVGIIASSVATIAVCSSMIIGSTYALFTSEDKVDVAITSGNVEVTAEVQNLGTDYDKEHVTASNVQASIAGNTVTLDKMLPGDIVTFDIVIENKSNVDIQYRTSVICEEGFELMSGLDFAIGGEDYSGLVKYVTDWSEWEGEATQTVSVTISLPWDAGNEYKNLSCKIAYAVEAVQGNADKSGEQGELIKTKVSTAEELDSALNYVAENGGQILLQNDIALENVEHSKYYAFWEETKIDLNGHNLVVQKEKGNNQYPIFFVGDGASLTIENGKLDLDSGYEYSNGIESRSKLIFNNVNYTAIGAGVYALGSGADVQVINSSIDSTYYGLATSATKPENYNVKIEVVNSTVQTHGDATPVIINVPGILNIDGSTLIGERQAVIVRGGTVNISNSIIKNTVCAETASLFNKYLAGNWSSGNEVPFAALVIGNRGKSYAYPSICTLTNTEFVCDTVEIDGTEYTSPKIYVYGNSTQENGATLIHDLDETITAAGGETTVKKIDLTISTAAQLQAFADEVNGGNNYAGKLVVLANDIDLSGINWTPIGFNGKSFNGIFDGLGHTISNLCAVHEEANNVALFGIVKGNSKNTKITNVNLDNVTVKGVDSVGAVVGQGVCLIENVNVTNADVVGGHYVGGVVGYGYAYVNNCNVSNSSIVCNPYKVNGEWDNGDKVGGVVGYLCAADATNCTVTNTTVKAWRDVGGVIGSVGNSDGHICIVLGNVAENVTVDYVENSDYTRDHENLGIIYGRFVSGSLEDAIANGYVQPNV